MIRRIYADNFRCLVNFELELDELNVLLGANCHTCMPATAGMTPAPTRMVACGRSSSLISTSRVDGLARVKYEPPPSAGPTSYSDVIARGWER